MMQKVRGAVQEHLQRRSYRRLLAMAGYCEHESTYADKAVAGLTKKQSARARLPAERSDISVVGFGTDDDWRRHGLWEAFRGLAQFTLFEVPDTPWPGCKNGEEERHHKCEEFLRFIDALLVQSPIHMVFFSHSGRHVSDRLISELHCRRIWTVMMSVDDKHQFTRPADREGRSHQLRVARQVDLYWTSWRTGAEIVLGSGGNPWFAPPAADPGFHRAVDVPRDLDVVFVGARYGQRKHLVEHLRRRGICVDAFGFGWAEGAVSFDAMIAVFSRAKVVLGVGGVGCGLSIRTLKGRDFEVPMCGAVYLTSYNPELCQFFNIGTEILCYSTFEDCEELLRWALRNPQECEALRKAALRRSVGEHTWKARVTDMLALWNI